MTWDEVDWASLERLRALFLRSEPVREPYWRTLSDLASYDFTYAQRIAWKWGAALSELQRLNWAPPSGPLLSVHSPRVLHRPSARSLLRHASPRIVTTSMMCWWYC